ncbi:MAG: lysophospholipid acyltransferase family protein [Kiritimatiellia bacterium]
MKRRTKKKTILRALRMPFEWFGIALGFAAFVFATRRTMLRICDFAALAMHTFDRRGKELARENLVAIYGALPAKADLIVRRAYRNMARSVGYAFWTCVRARKRAAAAGEMDARGRDFLARNRPAITVSAHLGCWEILSQLAFLEGHSMVSVAKAVGTKGMTRLLMRARRSIGQEIVPAEGAFRPLMNALRHGKSLGLLIDQCVDPREGGVWVRFFGRPVPVSSAPAFFSAKSGAPIVIAWSRPLRDGRWRCEVLAEYPGADARKDIWRTTQNCLSTLERAIRRHPSCWVLNYRYFRKRIKPEELRQLEQREGRRS